MKRIYLSLIMIVATLSLVVGAAYAYFTSNSVSITGVTLATSGPVLKISNVDQISSYSDTITGTKYLNIYPNWYSTEETFYLKNMSNNGAPIAQVIPTTTATTNDNWDLLKDVIEACFKETSDVSSCTTSSSDWYSLDYWTTNSATGLLSSGILADSFSRQISIKYRMLASADDTAKNKTITDLEWDFVGRTN